MSPRACLLLGLLALGCGVAPVPGPPATVRTVAVLTPGNRTGDELLVAGTSVLERYAFGTERVTVPQVLAIELRAALARRGYAVTAPELVVAATEGRPVYGPEAAAEIARHGHLDEPVLMVVVDQWQPDAPTQPAFVIVALEAALVEPSSGTVLWHTRRRASPVATPGSVTLGAAYEIAVQKVVENLIEAWGTERPQS
jgi:hypothetical protein